VAESPGQGGSLKIEDETSPVPKVKMIIPVRCMNCGKLIGDKYNYFQRRIRESLGSTEPLCLDGKTIPKTVEVEIFAELGIDRYCCKKTLRNHVDLIKKL